MNSRGLERPIRKCTYICHFKPWLVIRSEVKRYQERKQSGHLGSWVVEGGMEGVAGEESLFERAASRQSLGGCWEGLDRPRVGQECLWQQECTEALA